MNVFFHQHPADAVAEPVGQSDLFVACFDFLEHQLSQQLRILCTVCFERPDRTSERGDQAGVQAQVKCLFAQEISAGRLPFLLAEGARLFRFVGQFDERITVVELCLAMDTAEPAVNPDADVFLEIIVARSFVEIEKVRDERQIQMPTRTLPADAGIEPLEPGEVRLVVDGLLYLTLDIQERVGQLR